MRGPAIMKKNDKDRSKLEDDLNLTAMHISGPARREPWPEPEPASDSGSEPEHQHSVKSVTATAKCKKIDKVI